jgi:hypothetical protein
MELPGLVARRVVHDRRRRQFHSGVAAGLSVRAMRPRDDRPSVVVPEISQHAAVA